MNGLTVRKGHNQRSSLVSSVRTKGGDAIDFIRKFYNKDYAEAVQMLLNNGGSQIITSPPIEKEHKPFKLPPRNDRMSRVFLICC